MSKWLAVLAAASLAAAPAIAQPIRTTAPIGDREALRGGVPAVAWIIALVMVVGAILIISDDDAPESP